MTLSPILLSLLTFRPLKPVLPVSYVMNDNKMYRNQPDCYKIRWYCSPGPYTLHGHYVSRTFHKKQFWNTLHLWICRNSTNSKFLAGSRLPVYIILYNIHMMQYCNIKLYDVLSKLWCHIETYGLLCHIAIATSRLRCHIPIWHHIAIWCHIAVWCYIATVSL